MLGIGDVLHLCLRLLCSLERAKGAVMHVESHLVNIQGGMQASSRGVPGGKSSTVRISGAASQGQGGLPIARHQC